MFNIFFQIQFTKIFSTVTVPAIEELELESTTAFPFSTTTTPHVSSQSQKAFTTTYEIELFDPTTAFSSSTANVTPRSLTAFTTTDVIEESSTIFTPTSKLTTEELPTTDVTLTSTALIELSSTAFTTVKPTTADVTQLTTTAFTDPTTTVTELPSTTLVTTSTTDVTQFLSSSTAFPVYETTKELEGEFSVAQDSTPEETTLAPNRMRNDLQVINNYSQCPKTKHLVFRQRQNPNKSLFRHKFVSEIQQSVWISDTFVCSKQFGIE